MDEEFLTIDELAALLRVKRSWLYAETCKGEQSKIPVIRIGRMLRFQRKEVLSALGIKDFA